MTFDSAAAPAAAGAAPQRGPPRRDPEWSDGNAPLTIAGGLTPDELEEQWREIDAVRASDPGIALRRSMEVDILPDGTLDLPDDHLAALDGVLVAVHVQQKLPRAEQTRRILHAIEHPSVDILGHPTGKRGRRPSYDVDLDAVLRHCAELDVAVELDCSPDRSDLSAENVRRALELGCAIVIDTDAHSLGELEHMRYGVGQARRRGARHRLEPRCPLRLACIMATDELTARATPSALPPADGAPPPGTMIGRFIVLDTLGAGGMGLVLSAYDPPLDRKVAVKLLRPGVGGPDTLDKRTLRLLREAQAMAKIAHRNVIAIHEVGTWRDQVFLAMEHIDGQTLSGWLATPHTPREIIARFVAAARGLEAAHALGLVHRDFKPDNVLVARDGRVLVTDFGVVAMVGDAGSGEVSPEGPTGLTRDGAIVGTPAYMAPEQRAGGNVDARADQYAFCVALEAALGASMPRWVRPLVQRGLTHQAVRRHPSMKALADALDRGPRPTLRLLSAVGFLAAAAVAVGVTARHAPSAPPPCEGFEARLQGVWDGDVRARLDAAFAKSGRRAAADNAARVAAALDGYSRAWVDTRRDACLATAVRHEQSPALLDLRMACLDRRLGAARALTQLLASADGDVVLRAPEAALALEPLAGCSDAAALTAAIPAPRDPAQRDWLAALERRQDALDALWLAGKRKLALPLAAQVAIEAEANGYAPARARALTSWALAARDAARADVPEIVGHAVVAAAAARDDVRVARNLGFLVTFFSENGKREQAAALRPALLAAAERSDDDVARSRAHYSLGVALSDVDQLVAADAELRTALALQERATGPDDLELVRIIATRAAVLNGLARLDEARALLDRGVAIVERRLGPDNTLIMGILNSLGNNAHLRDDHDAAFRAFDRMQRIGAASYGASSPRLWVPMGNAASELSHLGRKEEALALSRRALPLAETSYGPDAPAIGELRLGIASDLADLHRRDEARREIDAALAILERREPDGLSAALALTVSARLLRGGGKAAEALALYRRVLAIREQRLPAGHMLIAHAMTSIAGCLIELGRAAEARPLLLRALQMETGGPSFAVLHAEIVWELSKITIDPARRHALAAEARAIYATKNESESVAQIDAWLATRRP